MLRNDHRDLASTALDAFILPDATNRKLCRG